MRPNLDEVEESLKTMRMFCSMLPKWAAFMILALTTPLVNAAVITEWTSSSSFLAQLTSGSVYQNDFQGESYGTTPAFKDYSSVSPVSPSLAFRIDTVTGGSLFVAAPGGHPALAMSTATAEADLRLTFRTTDNFNGTGGARTLPTGVGGNFFVTGDEVTVGAGEPVLVGQVDFIITYTPDGGATTFSESFLDRSVTSTSDYFGFTASSGFSILSVSVQADDLSGLNEYATLDNLSAGQVTPVPEPTASGAIAALFLVVCSLPSLLRRSSASNVR